MPAALATQQVSLAAAPVHFHQIAKLYEKYRVDETESLHLVTVDIAEEARKVNHEIWDDCKQKLDAVFKSAGLL